ncbi:MAG TPA: hypothetical protein VMN03_08095 [Burkholderiales bacterium]|nr:hypothetical protein [Burkholderiales bacterium]
MSFVPQGSAADYRELDAAIRTLKQGSPLATWRGGEYDETALDLLVRNRTGIIRTLRSRGEWDEKNAAPTTPPQPADARARSKQTSGEDLMRATARRL